MSDGDEHAASARNKQIARRLVSAPGDLRVEVRRTLADDDLVAVHSHQRSPGEPGYGVIDIVRIDADAAAERWTLRRAVRPAEPGERDEFEGIDAPTGEQDEAGRERNRRLVHEMQALLFEQHRVEEALDRFFDPHHYLQHAPGAPDGIDFVRVGFIRRFSEHPRASSALQHLIADGDLVLIHRRTRLAPDAPLRLVCDIFRLRGDRIVEHWDVTQWAGDEGVSG